jgi:hypothetical protein
MQTSDSEGLTGIIFGEGSYVHGSGRMTVADLAGTGGVLRELNAAKPKADDPRSAQIRPSRNISMLRVTGRKMQRGRSALLLIFEWRSCLIKKSFGEVVKLDVSQCQTHCKDGAVSVDFQNVVDGGGREPADTPIRLLCCELALALRSGCPIFVSEEVLQAGKVLPKSAETQPTEQDVRKCPGGDHG